MLYTWIILCFGALMCSGQSTTPQNPNWNSTWTDSLKRDLLLNYDKFARPAHHLNATTVNLKLTVRHVELDEDKSLMTVYGWIKMVWTDDKLKWNASDYGNLEIIHLADHEIWQPDILLYNSATGSSMDHYGNTNCLVKNNGEVLWVPPSQFTVFCSMDLRLWPYDQQTCTLVLGSWTYSGEQINLITDEIAVLKESLIANHEWAIDNMVSSRNVKYYECCKEPYIDITFNITVSRRTPMYETVCITPATVVILLTLASFWLPVQSGEKVVLNGFIALIISLFLAYFGQRLSAMALNTPLVVLFYSSSLYLVCFSMIISVIVLNISKTKQSKPTPWAIKKALDGPLGTILGLNHLHVPVQIQPRSEELQSQPFDEHNTSEDHQIIQSNKKGPIQQDWIILATAIDRIAFLIYCIVFAILAVTYSV